MEVQHQPRLDKIRRTSGYVSKCLTFSIWVMYFLAYIGLIYALFTPAGEGTVLDLVSHFSNEGDVLRLAVEKELTLPAMAALLLLIFVALYFMIMATRQLQKLMTLFQAGHIFKTETLACAKRALNFVTCTVAYVVVLKAAAYGSDVYFHPWQGSLITLLEMVTSIATGLGLLGLLHLAFWGLEIGCELKEESELTI